MDNMNLKARDLFSSLLSDILVRTLDPKVYGPGKVIERLSPEKREILKGLKSDDVRNMRIK